MNKTFEITQPLVDKINALCEVGLSHGLGVREPGKMCVEAAVAYAIGLSTHTDDPGCVNYALRSLKIRLNDSVWSSNEARGKGLRRLAVAQLGTKDWTKEQELEFVTSVIKEIILLVKEYYKDSSWNLWADNWLNGVDRSKKSAYDAAVSHVHVSGSASYGAYTACCAAAAVGANAAANAAGAAANAADAAAYAAYTIGTARDKVLADYCERVVKILIRMDTPGSKWL